MNSRLIPSRSEKKRVPAGERPRKRVGSKRVPLPVSAANRQCGRAAGARLERNDILPSRTADSLRSLAVAPGIHVMEQGTNGKEECSNDHTQRAKRATHMTIRSTQAGVPASEFARKRVDTAGARLPHNDVIPSRTADSLRSLAVAPGVRKESS